MSEPELIELDELWEDIEDALSTSSRDVWKSFRSLQTALGTHKQDTAHGRLLELLAHKDGQLTAAAAAASQLQDQLDGSRHGNWFPRKITPNPALPVPRIEFVYEEEAIGDGFTYRITYLLIVPEPWGQKELNGFVLGWMKRGGGPMWRSPGVLNEGSELEGRSLAHFLGIPAYRIAKAGAFVQAAEITLPYPEQLTASVALGILGASCEERRPDTPTLDRIAVILDGRSWTPETLEDIANEIRNTGRPIGDPDE